MRKQPLLIIPILVLALLACNLSVNVPQVETQVGGLLTSAPTLLGPAETAAANAIPTSSCPSTPNGSGLGIQVDTAESVLQASGQFTFTDTTLNGQQAMEVGFSDTGKKAFPALASGSSALLVGDPCNLSEIQVTFPRSDNQDTVTQALTVMTLLFAGVLPLDVSVALIPWLTTNYSSVPVGGQVQTTIHNMLFTLKRDAATMMLDVLPGQ
jgi:hypothetical protein